MKRQAIAAIAILLACSLAAAHHPTPTVTISFGAKLGSFGTSMGTLQGIAYSGGSIYMSSTNAIAKYSTGGAQSCITDTSTDASPGDSNNDLTVTGGAMFVGQKSGTTAYVSSYNTVNCAYLNSWNIGSSGTVSAITYNDNSFWVVWADDSQTPPAYTMRQYSTTFQLQDSWSLPVFATNTGPQGVAWIGDRVIMPRHSADGDFGMLVMRYDAWSDSFVEDTTLTYVSWTGSTRTEHSSQGIDIDQATNTVYFAGREAATGNGGGTGDAAWFPINVQRTQNYASSPPWGTLQDNWNTNLGTLQGITSDATHVYVAHTAAISKWTLDGAFVTSINTSGNGHGNQNGGLYALDGTLYVSTSNYPTLPRQQYIATYSTSLGYVSEVAVGAADGSGGGLGFHDEKLVTPLIKNAGEQLYLRYIDPTSLAVVQDVLLGNHGGFQPQGIGFLGNRAYIPHGNIGSFDAKDGVYVYERTGTSWASVGEHQYPAWLSTTNGTEYGTQDMHFQVAATCDSAVMYTVGRQEDGNGYGRGDVAAFTATSPNGQYCASTDNGTGTDTDTNTDDGGGGGGNIQQTSDNQLLLVGGGLAGVVLLVAFMAPAKAKVGRKR